MKPAPSVSEEDTQRPISELYLSTSETEQEDREQEVEHITKALERCVTKLDHKEERKNSKVRKEKPKKRRIRTQRNPKVWSLSRMSKE